MKFKVLIVVAIACLGIGMVSMDAAAYDRNPASCLLYPLYDTSPESLAVMTITNVGDVTLAVRLVWVDHEVCTPEDQWIELTAGDTFTFIDSAMNPEFDEQGFMYAYVVESVGSTIEEDADCLIGQELFFSVGGGGGGENSIPGNLQYGVNAQPFEALNIVKDGDLHLDGSTSSYDEHDDALAIRGLAQGLAGNWDGEARYGFDELRELGVISGGDKERPFVSTKRRMALLEGAIGQLYERLQAVERAVA